jgi:hypothetical protein
MRWAGEDSNLRPTDYEWLRAASQDVDRGWTDPLRSILSKELGGIGNKFGDKILQSPAGSLEPPSAGRT